MNVEVPTHTSDEQTELAEKVMMIYSSFFEKSEPEREEDLRLLRRVHIHYCARGIQYLSEPHKVLDSSRTWLTYWTLHSLRLLGHPIDATLSSDVVDFISRCQHPDGGYGGGPGQIAHLASTYAAICTLMTLGTEEALASVDRAKLHDFIVRCKVPPETDKDGGGFKMHSNGEVDMRGCFCALAVAHMMQVKTEAVTRGAAAYVERCQTYEGGMGGEPCTEAHGGYTFCGLAAHMLLDQQTAVDIPGLLRWAVWRQGAAEGGFNGRTNKLVDGCYSFWQGGVFPLLAQLLPRVQMEAGGSDRPVAPGGAGGAGGAGAVVVEEQGEGEEEEVISTQGSLQECTAAAMFPPSNLSVMPGGAGLDEGMLFNSLALQGWLLVCCQVPQGGLKDKPGESRDYYHTCYCLSGLSVAQHWDSCFQRKRVLGPAMNLLELSDPVVNVVEAQMAFSRAYFKDKPFAPALAAPARDDKQAATVSDIRQFCFSEY